MYRSIISGPLPYRINIRVDMPAVLYKDQAGMVFKLREGLERRVCSV
ncbi:MAG: hypothetical protein JEZ11_15525 [Desulfobacterales bacterium]|nr:hypothetical protein [Desulfobacterales bacterium]